MTGYFAPSGPAPLSALSVRSLADLGYSVNIAAADPFQVSNPQAPGVRLRGSSPQTKETEIPPSHTSAPHIEYGNDTLIFPLVSLAEFVKD